MQNQPATRKISSHIFGYSAETKLETYISIQFNLVSVKLFVMSPHHRTELVHHATDLQKQNCLVLPFCFQGTSLAQILWSSKKED